MLLTSEIIAFKNRQQEDSSCESLVNMDQVKDNLTLQYLLL